MIYEPIEWNFHPIQEESIQTSYLRLSLHKRQIGNASLVKKETTKKTPNNPKNQQQMNAVGFQTCKIDIIGENLSIGYLFISHSI